MQIFFSPSASGFYCIEVHGDNMPADAIAISDELYRSLQGRQIAVGLDGLPELYVAPPPSLSERRDTLKAAATKKRFEVETGGLTLPNGARVGTDRDDQNSIANAVAAIALTGLEAIDFKASGGAWVSIAVPELQTIAAAVGRHKQACFTAERLHHEAIDALADEKIDGYDVAVGWPGTVLEPEATPLA